MSDSDRLENVNPMLYDRTHDRVLTDADYDDSIEDPVDVREIFDLIRDINDPEHPLTLEQLNVVTEDQISVDDKKNDVQIMSTPTIPHCSMATLIGQYCSRHSVFKLLLLSGLAIRVKLLRSLPDRFKVSVSISPGTHASEAAINKQLADKERVAAALENNHLLTVVNQCLDASSIDL